MRPRILIIGVPHQELDSDLRAVSEGSEAPSLFDYDAVIVDVDSIFPSSWRETVPIDLAIQEREEVALQVRSLLDRFSKEVGLLIEKGGMLVCLLRPSRRVLYRVSSVSDPSYQRKQLRYYQWIPISDLDDLVADGSGERIHINDKASPFSEYLRHASTRWTAYFDNVQKLKDKMRVIAVNDVEKSVALEFRIGNGKVVFLPVNESSAAGTILAECTRGAIAFEQEADIPSWIHKARVPLEDEILESLTGLEKDMLRVEKERSAKQGEYSERTRIKRLLYEKGEPLEEVVKEAFQELGFTVVRKGDMDWVVNSDTGEAVLEVTGSDDAIEITKLRQLLDNTITEYGRTQTEKKAILVGNHFARRAPEDRGAPFTQKVLATAQVYSMCLLPTTELFKALCSIREGKVSACTVRHRIFNTIGVFET
jgi:hypothetical protein